MKRNLCLLLLLVLFWTPARSAPPPPGASVPQLQALLETLQDTKSREAFLQQLQTLIAASKAAPVQPAPAPAQAPEGSSLISMVSDEVGQVSDDLLAVVSDLADPSHLQDWLQHTFGSAEGRALALRVAGKVAAALAAGVVVEIVLRRVAGRSIRKAEARPPAPGRLLRLPRLLVRTMLDMLPPVGFYVTVHLVLPLLHPGRQSSLTAITVADAYLSAALLLALSRAVLSPGAPSLRLFAFNEENATYLYIWARRLIQVVVYGYFLYLGAYLAGLAQEGRILLKGAALVVATMLIILILQNRHAVAALIRGQRPLPPPEPEEEGDEPDPGPPQPVRPMGKLRQWLAEVWHVLALVYIVAAFCVWALEIPGGFHYVIRGTTLTALVIIANRLLSRLVERGVARGFAVGHEWQQRFPQLEERANRYLPVLELVLKSVVTFISFLLFLQVWGLDALGWLARPGGRALVGSAVGIGLTLFLSLAFWEFFRIVTDRYLASMDGRAAARIARARTLVPLLRKIVLGVLITLAALVVLSELGLNIAPLLAGAGVVGLAIGFGSQKLVQDIITGAFILFEDAVAVGDVVDLGGHKGVVEALSVRSIRLRDAVGAVHTIPFSAVATVINMSRDFAFAAQTVHVGYSADIDRVEAVLREIGRTLRADPALAPGIRDDLDFQGIDSFADSGIAVKVVIKTSVTAQPAVQRALNRLIKQALDDGSLERPRPRTTVAFAEGDPPPFRVRLENNGIQQDV